MVVLYQPRSLAAGEVDAGGETLQHGGAVPAVERQGVPGCEAGVQGAPPTVPHPPRSAGVVRLHSLLLTRQQVEAR